MVIIQCYITAGFMLNICNAFFDFLIRWNRNMF